MDRQKTIFLAFAGQPIEQPESIFEIQNGYECWDLKKFTLDEFVDVLQRKIKPVNKNVLRNYKTKDDNKNMFCITEKNSRNVLGVCSFQTVGKILRLKVLPKLYSC